ncbi:methyl-accepting chemotaxis protein I [Enterobacter cloacae]|uniref:Methyl-accepting chemotaxis protein I n=1 Tax=Enterobacter cloacae TaxID=550 RepID=A0A377M7P6_ENTCL|nr:methyl-accepting chemotaxis protein I [Enterobacter cloacae]
MLNRIKIVTSLMLVLAIFGLLQLTSGGLFFNALKHDKENFTVLQTIRQQQSTLNASWVALLQTRNTLNRAGIRYMMDQNNIGSGATVNDLMQIASVSLKQAEKNWAAYEALPRDPRQSDAEAMEIKRNYDIYHGALAELIQLLGAGKINAFFDQPTQSYQDGFEKQYVNYLLQNDKLYQMAGGKQQQLLQPGDLGADQRADGCAGGHRGRVAGYQAGADLSADPSHRQHPPYRQWRSGEAH